MMHLHHQEIATFMKNDLKSAVHTGALITSDQNHYMELAQGGIFSRAIFSSEYLAYSQVPIKRVGPNKRVGWIFIKCFCLSLCLFLSSCFFGAKYRVCFLSSNNTLFS